VVLTIVSTTVIGISVQCELKHEVDVDTFDVVVV